MSEWRIALFAVWVGQNLPVWLSQFLERIGASAPLIDFKLVHLSDRLQVEAFCDRVEKMTGARPARPLNPRKVCDFRPAFGDIFADMVGSAEWFGWCDLDCIFGDMPAFITPERLEAYDLITDHPSIVNGPFTIMRNTEKTRKLYRRYEDWGYVFRQPEHIAFDEVGFTQVVQDASDVKSLFLEGVHYHDNWQGEPRLEDGVLYAPDGNEILTYHFPRQGKGGIWPLSKKAGA